MSGWPKVFHRIWLDEEERPEFAKWRDDLATMHPDWEIRTWASSEEIIEAGWMRHVDEFKGALETDPFGRAPDILRYEILWNFGGVYIDTDFEPLRPLDELVADGRPFIGWENDERLCTAMFGAPPQHPALGVLMDRLQGSLERNRKKDPTIASGPGYATPHLRSRDDVNRCPISAFYPVGWWEKKLLGKIDYPPETYAVHWWNKGWGA